MGVLESWGGVEGWGKGLNFLAIMYLSNISVIYEIFRVKTSIF